MIVSIFYPRCVPVRQVLELTMIRGSCVCGGIKFEIEKVVALTHCHRSICRKESGASFATYEHVRRERFNLLGGEEFIDPGYEMDPWSFAELLSALRFTGAEVRRGNQDG
jgi:hypothetical protein